MPVAAISVFLLTPGADLPPDADGSFTGTKRPTLVASYSATNNTGPCDATAPTPCTSGFNWWRTDTACTATPPNV